MTDLVARTEDKAPAILRPLVKPDELIAAQNEISQLIVKALKKGTDYGSVPGTQGKDTLLKPGAERIQKAFGCHTTFDLIEKEVDHDREVQWRKTRWEWNNQTRRKESVEVTGTSFGLYRFVVRANVIGPHGQVVGSGIGSCSTLENKYVDRPRDLENTVLKMAQKRAKVAATLDAFALSDRFTQDMEDQVETEQEEPAAKPANKPTGFDPQDRKMQDWLIVQLKKEKIDDSRWDDVAAALRGRPSTDLKAVLAQVIGS